MIFTSKKKRRKPKNLNPKISFKKRIPVPVLKFLDFIRFIVEYGILLSIIAYGVFNFYIDVWRVLGLGILYYFIVEESRTVYRYWKSWRIS